MIPVGGADGLIDRLLFLLGWKATAVTTDQERKDALACLNWAQRFVNNREALLHLNYTWSITVGVNATKIDLAAAPFTTIPFDYTKDHLLRDGNGMPIEYLPIDRFHRAFATNDRVFTSPSGYIISVDDADSKRYIMFDEAQPASATFKLHGQRYPADLTDANNSYMLLPEGDELVLGLPIAEQFAKTRKFSMDVEVLDAGTRAELEFFYARNRTNKLTPATDGNRTRRINEAEAARAAGE